MDATSLINQGLHHAPTFAQLTLFAQFLVIGVDFFTPMLYTWNVLDAANDRLSRGNNREIENNIYDFIVVGAGSSGSVVANRLSETHNVLLIEAGGTPNPWQRVPILTYVLHGRSPIDWKYKTVPQKAANFGLNDGVGFWPSGKGLGGSSNINGMIYLRGNVQGFDTMANLSGNPMWSMKNMLKIYRELEDYSGFYEDDIGTSHAKGGKLSIEKSHLHPVTKQFLKAGQDLGYPIRDPNRNGPVTEGFSPMDFYLKDGRRWSAYHGYLRDVMGTRKTLTVLKYAVVTKVLMDKNNRAYGVEYVQDGIYKTAKASKEVILSAGSIQSAKLLMLSGIGPKKDLEKLGINVRVDAPVGQILQDKYGALVGPFVSTPKTSFIRERDLTVSSVLEWATRGTGPVKCSRAEATFTISSNISKEEGTADFPDIHSYMLTWSVDERFQEDMSNAFNIKQDILKNYFGPTKGKDSFVQMVTINKVTGAGTVKLKSKNPFDHPLIDPKYLQNERDVKVLVEGIKFAVKVVEETPSYKGMNAGLQSIPLPGCEKHVFRSDSYWECVGRSLTLTAYKYSATAPIGKNRADPEAVVDSELRVFGTRGLRVVDASVLQVRQISVNHVTVQAVAELGSKFIKNSWEPYSKISNGKLHRFNNRKIIDNSV